MSVPFADIICPALMHFPGIVDDQFISAAETGENTP
jgi:hypothetical protein